ncbi:MAG TPA: TIGR04423 family type III CRISPR-associated protein [Candidatus Cloacimonadota bacterium]|nr:TIGR04423 family type III CRISPR-associated protein [Candidatus Cloacimonadota bacterium]
MNSIVTTTQHLNDIPKLKYQGYVWLDNSEKPVLDEFSMDILKDRGFIVEAYLYNAEKQISVSIKHIDGSDYITIFDLNQINQEYIFNKKYIANREISKQDPAYKYLKFIEYWLPEQDVLCSNMKVKKLKWIAFTGFDSADKEPKNDEK